MLFKDDEYVIEPKAAELSSTRKPDILDLAGRSISDNLRYGNFYQQLLPFYEVFGDEGMIFLDGTNMGEISNSFSTTVHQRPINYWIVFRRYRSLSTHRPSSTVLRLF